MDMENARTLWIAVGAVGAVLIALGLFRWLQSARHKLPADFRSSAPDAYPDALEDDEEARQPRP